MAQFEAKEIGARIAQARREAGLTQEQLAELAPFSTRSLQDYERGETIPYRQMRDISRLLGKPVEWFLHGDDEEEQSILERLDELVSKLDALDRKLDGDREAIEQRLLELQRQLQSAQRGLQV